MVLGKVTLDFCYSQTLGNISSFYISLSEECLLIEFIFLIIHFVPHATSEKTVLPASKACIVYSRGKTKLKYDVYVL